MGYSFLLLGTEIGSFHWSPFCVHWGEVPGFRLSLSSGQVTSRKRKGTLITDFLPQPACFSLPLCILRRLPCCCRPVQSHPKRDRQGFAALSTLIEPDIEPVLKIKGWSAFGSKEAWKNCLSNKPRRAPVVHREQNTC
jgi:hypothetical protein